MKNHYETIVLGAGVKDAFWPRFSVRPWNFPAYAKAFHLMKTKLWWTENPQSLRGKVLLDVCDRSRRRASRPPRRWDGIMLGAYL